MAAKRRLAGIGLGVALLAGLSSSAVPAQATPSSSHAEFSVPVSTAMWASEESWCDNTGPHITVRSVSDTGGAGLQLTFKNNVKGTHTLQVVGSSAFTVLTPVTGEASIWKQPSMDNGGTTDGGVGGNPFMYIVDTAGDWHYIGRCVQDGKIGQINHGRFSATTNVGGFADATVRALTCSNKGSSLSIGTTAGAGSVSGYLVFTNSSFDVSVKRDPTHVNDDSGITASWGFSLSQSQVQKGQKDGVQGPGGNPLVSTATGATVNGVTTYGAPTDHGRCNKLY
jgi:hypothetical protein